MLIFPLGIPQFPQHFFALLLHIYGRFRRFLPKKGMFQAFLVRWRVDYSGNNVFGYDSIPINLTLSA